LFKGTSQRGESKSKSRLAEDSESSLSSKQTEGLNEKAQKEESRTLKSLLIKCPNRVEVPGVAEKET